MEVFAAIADPTRRKILDVLASGERSAGDLMRQFTLTQPAFSQHLRVLRDARLVRARRDAQRRIYSLDARGFEQLDSWLSRYHRFWNTHLDALERALQEEDK